jgi:hypothetical protein
MQFIFDSNGLRVLQSHFLAKLARFIQQYVSRLLNKRGSLLLIDSNRSEFNCLTLSMISAKKERLRIFLMKELPKYLFPCS